MAIFLIKRFLKMSAAFGELAKITEIFRCRAMILRFPWFFYNFFRIASWKNFFAFIDCTDYFFANSVCNLTN